MQVVYNNKTGEILAFISDIQKPRDYKNIPQEYISILNTERHLEGNIKYYKVQNNEILKRSDEEIEEIKRYRRVLTEEERLNILLSPSHEEINKAENTIEILATLQEVGII